MEVVDKEIYYNKITIIFIVITIITITTNPNNKALFFKL